MARRVLLVEYKVVEWLIGLIDVIYACSSLRVHGIPVHYDQGAISCQPWFVIYSYSYIKTLQNHSKREAELIAFFFLVNQTTEHHD